MFYSNSKELVLESFILQLSGLFFFRSCQIFESTRTKKNTTVIFILHNNFPCMNFRSFFSVKFIQLCLLKRNRMYSNKKMSNNVQKRYSKSVFHVLLRDFVAKSQISLMPYKCQLSPRNIPTGIYLFKVNIENASIMFKTCSKLSIKIIERRHWRRVGAFIVNLEQISPILLVLLLLILNK